jgi:O-antigen/teichoic acid export membrane protein
MRQYRSMLRKIGSNWFVLALAVLTNIFLVPFNLRQLGQEQYGLWLIIAAITAYLSLLELGIPTASVRSLSVAVVNRDLVKLNRMATSYGGFYLGLGIVSLVAGFLLLQFFESMYEVALPMQRDARVAFSLAVLTVVIGFAANLPDAILDSYEDFVRKNVLSGLVVLLRTGLCVVFVLLYPSLVSLAAAQLAGKLLEIVGHSALIVFAHREVRLARSYFSWTEVRDVLGFSLYVFLLAIGSQLSLQTSAIVIGHALGTEQVPLFAVPSSLCNYLMQLIFGIAAVIMPRATALLEQGNLRGLQVLFDKWSKLAIVLTWFAGVFLFVFGPEFLSLWVGPKFEQTGGEVLRILLVSYCLILPLRGVGMPILMGLRRAASPALAVVLAGIGNLGLSLLLVGPYGLNGVAWATTISNSALSVALLVLTCRELHLPVWHYAANTLPVQLFGLALVLGGAWIYREVFHPNGIIGLTGAVFVTSAWFALVWTRLVLRNDESVRLPLISELKLRQRARPP